MAGRTFRATVETTPHGNSTYGKVPIETDIVQELGLRPGENVRASMRGTEFTGKVYGSAASPSLLIPMDVLHALGVRDGQGVRVTVIGRP